MDGGWHNKNNAKSGQTKEKSKEIDDYKDEQAKLHNIEVIRIDCDYGRIECRFEYIKENVLNKLNKLFVLSKINWSKCNEFALLNLVKEACNYWNNGIKSTNEIGKLLNLNPTTICRYLKYGAKFNLCNYDGKESRNESLKMGKCTKPVEIFKDGILLGKFSSVMDLERQSEKLFGTKLYHSNISIVCNTESKRHTESYKGYMFKYANKI
jgi:hypothetical protein